MHDLRVLLNVCCVCLAGNSPWASGGSPERPLLVLGSMHTREQQANTAKLTKIGVPCLTHKQCPR